MVLYQILLYKRVFTSLLLFKDISVRTKFVKRLCGFHQCSLLDLDNVTAKKMKCLVTEDLLNHMPRITCDGHTPADVDHPKFIRSARNTCSVTRYLQL
jgi:hypothetical protein